MRCFSLQCLLRLPLGSGKVHQLRWASGYCLLFPGQGSQSVGMGKNLITAANSGTLPAVAKLFQEAEGVLGYDLRPLFLNGPQLRLDETVHCQPAVVVASLAALEAFRQTNPKVLFDSKAAAGFSVGEITALIATQSLSLEQGLQVVKVRAAAMQQACLQTHSCMLTIIGLTEDGLTTIINSVKTPQPRSELSVSNYLFPTGFVVSGHTDLVKSVGMEAEKSGAVVKEVRVSGAFHSNLMSSAVADLEAVLRTVKIEVPILPVYSNVTGLPYTSVDEIRTGMALQVTKPVLWEGTMSHMIKNYFRNNHKDKSEMRFVEIGPGKQLKGILKRIDRTVYRKCDSVTV